MWHKINDLVFSNSTVAFKTNYLMLNNLLWRCLILIHH
jgi:hypothetical protein